MVDAEDRQPYDAHHTAGACRQRALALFLLATLSEYFRAKQWAVATQ